MPSAVFNGTKMGKRIARSILSRPERRRWNPANRRIARTLRRDASQAGLHPVFRVLAALR